MRKQKRLSTKIRLLRGKRRDRNTGTFETTGWMGKRRYPIDADGSHSRRIKPLDPQNSGTLHPEWMALLRSTAHISFWKQTGCINKKAIFYLI